jgi:hypothetical protein
MSREEAKNVSVGMETGITWRKVGITHRTTNEILVDIIETLDAIIDQRGMIVNAEVSGVVRIYKSICTMLNNQLRLCRTKKKNQILLTIEFD